MSRTKGPCPKETFPDPQSAVPSTSFVLKLNSISDMEREERGGRERGRGERKRERESGKWYTADRPDHNGCSIFSATQVNLGQYNKQTPSANYNAFRVTPWVAAEPHHCTVLMGLYQSTSL